MPLPLAGIRDADQKRDAAGYRGDGGGLGGVGGGVGHGVAADVVEVFADVEHLDGVGGAGYAGEEAVHQHGGVGFGHHSGGQGGVHQQGYQLGDIGFYGDDALGRQAPGHTHAGLDVFLVGEHQDVVFGAEAGHFVGGAPAAGDDDGLGVQGLDETGGGAGYGLGLVVLGEFLVVVVGFFGFYDGGGGDLHRFYGVVADGDFVGQQDGIAPVQDGVVDVGDFGAGGGGGVDHRTEHLGGYGGYFAHFVGAAHHLFLDAGHFLHWHFHAQVAAGDHNAVHFVEDVVQVVHAFAAFQLCHYGGVAVELVEVGAGVADIVAGADEGEGYPVHFLRYAELQGDFVAFGDYGHIHGHIGEVDALVGGQVAADQHLSFDFQVGGEVQDFQADGAVGEEHAVAGAQVPQDGGFGEGEACVVIRVRGVDDGHGVAHIELDGVGHLSQSELVAAQILEDGDRAAVLAGGFADVGDDGGVFLQGAVGEVEAGDIHTGGDQLAEGLGGVGLGADGGDDFGFPHSCWPRVAGADGD